ncbi:MAG: sigma-70 family RNA polymerase sigma factor [Mucilaginibacter sp.]|jgi:RNA polymerase sigma-70 factor (ECF subfamily)|uniref:sigma-70 family RNA polymerase sigma factor n=1 Tax=Mucilaginibacter sp. TaxID=1882438 RepID=UPI003561BB34
MSPTQSTANPQNWVAMHADYLYAFAITRIGDEEQARDLVQDTFLSALEGLDKFERKSAERTWLTAILKNKIMDVYRKKSKQPITKSLDAQEGESQFFEPGMNNWKKEEWPAAFGIEEADPLQHKELQKILRACMQKLPPLWLSIFSMKHVDDESTTTICSELKVSDANFWVIIHRAKVNLRACLQKNWY